MGRIAPACRPPCAAGCRCCRPACWPQAALQTIFLHESWGGPVSPHCSRLRVVRRPSQQCRPLALPANKAQVVPALKALSCPRLCSPPLLPQASSSSSTPASSGATCASWRACGRRASCAWNWTPTALWACRPCRTRWSCCTRAVAAARWWCSCRRTCRRRRPSCEGWAGCREGE